MRSAAPALPAPWSGWARRTRRRKRCCTSSCSTSMSAREPEHLHRPAALRRHPGPRVLGAAGPPGAGRGRAHARDPLEAPRDVEALGHHAGTRDRVGDGPEPDRAPRRRERRRAHHRADHLRRRRPVEVELEARPVTAVLDVGAVDPVPGEIQPVRVGLQPVPQRDARDAQAVARVVEEATQGVELLLVEARQALRRPRHRAAPRRTPARSWAGRRRRARPAASAGAGACGGCSTRRAAPGPQPCSTPNLRRCTGTIPFERRRFVRRTARVG